MPAEILIPSAVALVLVLLLLFVPLRRRPRRSRRLAAAALEPAPQPVTEYAAVRLAPSARAPRPRAPRVRAIAKPAEPAKPAELEAVAVPAPTEASGESAVINLPPLPQSAAPDELEVQAEPPARPSRHRLSEEVQDRLSTLNQRLDELEHSIRELEGRLQRFDFGLDDAPAADATLEEIDEPPRIAENTIAA